MLQPPTVYLLPCQMPYRWECAEAIPESRGRKGALLPGAASCMVLGLLGLDTRSPCSPDGLALVAPADDPVS